MSQTESDAERRRLKGATVNGAAVNVVSQLLRFGLQFAYQIVMVRLLAPADFGLVALTAPLIAFVQIFSDLGLSGATIQQRSISQSQLSFLFWLNVAMGVLLAALTACAAPLVGWFYGDSRVVDVTIASGAILMLGGCYAQHLALLNRNMRFLAVAVTEIGGFAVGAIAGIAAALLGLGYWAIVVSVAGNSSTALLLAWTLSRWKPGRPGRTSDMRALLAFGGNLTGFNFVNFFARNSDNILIGRVYGEHSLGLYDRAYKLVLLPFSQISYPFARVAVPLLSRFQDEAEFYRRAYLRLLETVLLLTYPGLIFAIVTSRLLIVRVLGARWAEMSPIFSVLALDGFVAPIAGSMGWLFVSQGRTNEMRNWGIASSVLFVASFATGLQWGPTGVATGYVTAGLIEVLLLWRAATGKGALKGERLLVVIYPYIVSGGVTAVLLYALLQWLGDGWSTLAILAFAAHAFFVGTMALLPRGRNMLHEVAVQIHGLASPLLRSIRGCFPPKR